MEIINDAVVITKVYIISTDFLLDRSSYESHKFLIITCTVKVIYLSAYYKYNFTYFFDLWNNEVIYPFIEFMNF